MSISNENQILNQQSIIKKPNRIDISLDSKSNEIHKIKTLRDIKEMTSNRKSIRELEDITESLLFYRIENIFNNLKFEPSYFNRQRYIFVFISFVITFLIFFIIYHNTYPKNNFYCFNKYISQFKLCDQLKHCKYINSNHINTIFYIDIDELYEESNKINPSFLKKEDFQTQSEYEVYLLNISLKSYFFKDYLLKKNNNKRKLDTFEHKDYTSMLVYILNRESFSFYNTFYLLCYYEKIEMYLLIFQSLGIIFGCFFGTYFGDLLGRKKALIISLMIMTLSSFAIFLFTYFIINKIKEDQNEFILDILNFLNINTEDNNNIQLDFFKNVSVKFYNISIIQKEFFEKKIVFFLLNLTLFIGITLSFIFSSVLIIENSLNQSLIYKGLSLSNIGFFLGILTSNYICKFNVNYETIYLIFSILGLISVIISSFFLKESFRYYFEYSRYDKISELLESIIGKDKLKKRFKLFFNYQKQRKIEYIKEISYMNENNKYDVKAKFKEVLCLNYGFLLFLSKMFSKENYRKENINIREFIRYPYMYLYISLYNRLILKKRTIIYVILISNLLTWFLSIGMLNSTLFSNQKTLNLIENYSNILIYYNLFILILLYFFTKIFFFVYEFLGERIVLIICNIFILLFGIIFFFIQDPIRFGFNRNQKYYNSKELLYENKNMSLILIITFLLIFNAGAFFLILIQYSKMTYTISRCSSFGIYFFIYFTTMLISKLMIDKYDNYSMVFQTVFSILSLINSFISDSEEGSIVKDYRQIKLVEIDEN